MHIHISFASDNNYVQHLGAAIASLFETNRDVEQISVHILENNISSENLYNLKTIGAAYKREILFYNLNSTLKQIQKRFGIPPTIAITAYSRLFIADLLDPSIDKIIYADCDSIFAGSLRELWDTSFGSCMIMGVLDHVSPNAKTKIGLKDSDNYINSGFLFINLQKWRGNKAEERMISFIKKHNGNVFHHDQGIVNGCFSNEIKVISPKYNVMSSFYNFKNVSQILDFYGVKKYYSHTEIEEAKRQPVFVHFTPAFLKRPWVRGSKHPLKNQYFKFLENTAWKDAEPEPDDRQMKFKIVDAMFKILGPVYFRKIFK